MLPLNVFLFVTGQLIPLESQEKFAKKVSRVEKITKDFVLVTTYLDTPKLCKNISFGEHNTPRH